MNTPKKISIFYLMLGYILKDEAWIVHGHYSFFQGIQQLVESYSISKTEKMLGKDVWKYGKLCCDTIFSIFIHVCLQLHKTTKQQ